MDNCWKKFYVRISWRHRFRCRTRTKLITISFKISWLVLKALHLLTNSRTLYSLTIKILPTITQPTSRRVLVKVIWIPSHKRWKINSQFWAINVILEPQEAKLRSGRKKLTRSRSLHVPNSGYWSIKINTQCPMTPKILWRNEKHSTIYRLIANRNVNYWPQTTHQVPFQQ